jgi:hypothetical protein
MTETRLLRVERALREIRVHFARNSEAMAIAQMVHSSHVAVPAVDWSRGVYPHWIIASKGDEIVGCVQICYSTPIARMEFLSFVPGLSYRTRALAVKALLALAALTLKNAGAQVVAGCLGFDQKGFKEILKAEGCVTLMSGNIMARAVA